MGACTARREAPGTPQGCGSPKWAGQEGLQPQQSCHEHKRDHGDQCAMGSESSAMAKPLRCVQQRPFCSASAPARQFWSPISCRCKRDRPSRRPHLLVDPQLSAAVPPGLCLALSRRPRDVLQDLISPGEHMAPRSEGPNLQTRLLRPRQRCLAACVPIDAPQRATSPQARLGQYRTYRRRWRRRLPAPACVPSLPAAGAARLLPPRRRHGPGLQLPGHGHRGAGAGQALQPAGARRVPRGGAALWAAAGHHH